MVFNAHLQDTLRFNDSQLGELRKMLKHQESETQKAETKFKFSLDENEKLKASFNTERAAWEKEKTALLQRAEAAESSLKNTTAELSGLKRRISQMTAAIFGKQH